MAITKRDYVEAFVGKLKDKFYRGKNMTDEDVDASIFPTEPNAGAAVYQR